MTTVTFRVEGNRIAGFDARGHSGYAGAGADIVCAAVTSAIRLVEATVNDVLGLAGAVLRDAFRPIQSGSSSISARFGKVNGFRRNFAKKPSVSHPTPA